MIIVPIILPLIEALGFNLTWFAILVAVNLQTAWLITSCSLISIFLKRCCSRMGFKRYLSRNDAIYGTSDNWLDNYNNISKNCTVVANCLVWTVIYIGLI